MIDTRNWRALENFTNSSQNHHAKFWTTVLGWVALSLGSRTRYARWYRPGVFCAMAVLIGE